MLACKGWIPLLQTTRMGRDMDDGSAKLPVRLGCPSEVQGQVMPIHTDVGLPHKDKNITHCIFSSHFQVSQTLFTYHACQRVKHQSIGKL